MVVYAFFPIPTSWPESDRRAAREGKRFPTGKPDWENIGKCLDAFKNIVWVDDAQVIDGRVVKLYSSKPCLRVEVKERQ